MYQRFRKARGEMSKEKLKNNFREYIISLKVQAKKDKTSTLLDCASRNENNDYQRGFYDGYNSILDKIYEDCKNYEWKKWKQEGK